MRITNRIEIVFGALAWGATPVEAEAGCPSIRGPMGADYKSIEFVRRRLPDSFGGLVGRETRSVRTIASVCNPDSRGIRRFAIERGPPTGSEFL